jgi:hypothetical protein
MPDQEPRPAYQEAAPIYPDPATGGMTSRKPEHTADAELEPEAA